MRAPTVVDCPLPADVAGLVYAHAGGTLDEGTRKALWAGAGVVLLTPGRALSRGRGGVRSGSKKASLCALRSPPLSSDSPRNRKNQFPTFDWRGIPAPWKSHLCCKNSCTCVRTVPGWCSSTGQIRWHGALLHRHRRYPSASNQHTAALAALTQRGAYTGDSIQAAALSLSRPACGGCRASCGGGRAGCRPG